MMPTRVSIADLHQHTTYSKDWVGFNFLGLRALVDCSALESPYKRFKTNQRYLREEMAEQSLEGNIFVTFTDHDSPLGSYDLMKKRPEYKKIIIPAYEATVNYVDPFIERERTIHINAYGVSPSDYRILSRKQTCLAEFVDACKDRNIPFQLNHPLWTPQYVDFNQEQFEYLLREFDFPMIELINGTRDPCNSVTLREILAILSKKWGRSWVCTAGSDDHSYYAGTTWTAVEYSDTKEDFLNNLMKGNVVRLGGEEGRPDKIATTIWDYLYARMTPKLQDYLNRMMVSHIGSLDRLHAGVYPLLAGRVLKEWKQMYTQSDKLRKAYGLSPLADVMRDHEAPPFRERKIRIRDRPKIHGKKDITPWDHDTVLFFSDVPVAHHSGVGMWIHEMVKYVGKNGPHIVIFQPGVEHLPNGYEVKQVNENVRLVSVRPTIKLFSSQESTKDFPIDPTVSLGVFVSSKDHGSISVPKMLVNRRSRQVNPYSLGHTILRTLIDRGAMGRPRIGVFIQDGPYAKLGYASCKGYLDIPKIMVFVTNVPGFVTHRLKKLIRDQYDLPEEVINYGVVEKFMGDVLNPFRDMLWGNTMRFLNRCEMVLAPPAMVETLRERGIETEIRVFGRGVDTSRFTAGKRERERIRLMYAGRVSDTDHNIFEIADIVRDMDGLKTYIVGEGPDTEELRGRMPASTIFPGRISHDDVAGEMGRADIVIVPSIQHTHGNIYYEALACSAVVLARESRATKQFTRGVEYPDFARIYSSVEEAREFLLGLTADRGRLRAMQAAARERAATAIDDWGTIFRNQLFENILSTASGFQKNLTLRGMLRNARKKSIDKAKFRNGQVQEHDMTSNL